MARDLFIDLTNRRLAVSETNSAPAGQIQFTKGDNGAFNLYFLEATGIINRPFEVVTQPGTVTVWHRLTHGITRERNLHAHIRRRHH
jgi:hypothetical protein